MMKYAFTLIELLIVIIIIGILATMAIPQYQKMIRKSESAQAMLVLDAIYKAVQYYYQTHDAWPDNESAGGTWDADNAIAAGMNSYLKLMGIDFIEIPEKGCEKFTYDLYQGGPAVCDNGDNPKCSIKAWRKDVGARSEGNWTIRRRLYTGEQETNPSYYP